MAFNLMVQTRHLFAPDRDRMDITDGEWALWIEGTRWITLMFEDDERDAIKIPIGAGSPDNVRNAIATNWWDIEDEETR